MEAPSNWAQLSPLRKVNAEDAVNGFYNTRAILNQYEAMTSLLDKLQNRAEASITLMNSCAGIVTFVKTMKNEFGQHRDVLISEDQRKLFDKDDDDDLTEESRRARKRVLEKLGAAKTFDSDLEEEFELSPGTVRRIVPLLFSALYKVSRYLNLLVPDIDDQDSPFTKFMIYVCALEIFPVMEEKLSMLPKYLAQLDMRKSKNSALISELAKKTDLNTLGYDILAVLTEFKTRGALGTSKNLLSNLIERLKATETTEKTMHEVLIELKPDLKLLTESVANICDDQRAEIKAIDFKSGKFLFERAFGKSFEAHLNENKVFAKQVTIRSVLSVEARRELQVEIEAIRFLHSERVAKFMGTVVSKNQLFLVWDYYEETLFDLIFKTSDIKEFSREGIHLTNEFMTKLAIDILSGLEFLHDQGIIHQDLSTRNVLLKNDLKAGACLGDFCFVDGKRELRKKSTDYKDSELVNFDMVYRAPETLFLSDLRTGSIHLYESDIYSFGIIFFEMIEKRHAFEGLSFAQFQKLILNGAHCRPNQSASTTKRTPRLVKQVLNRCWQHLPELRPSAGTLSQELTFQLGNGYQVEQSLRKIRKGPEPKRDPDLKKWLSWISDGRDVPIDAEVVSKSATKEQRKYKTAKLKSDDS